MITPHNSAPGKPSNQKTNPPRAPLYQRDHEIALHGGAGHFREFGQQEVFPFVPQRQSPDQQRDKARAIAQYEKGHVEHQADTHEPLQRTLSKLYRILGDIAAHGDRCGGNLRLDVTEVEAEVFQELLCCRKGMAYPFDVASRVELSVFHTLVRAAPSRRKEPMTNRAGTIPITTQTARVVRAARLGRFAQPVDRPRV